MDGLHKFKAAIRASNLTLKQASELVGVSVPTISERQEAPMQFRLGELKALYDGMDDVGKRLIKEALDSIFLPG